MSLLDDLRAVVGADQVLSGGDLSAWEIDWRRRYRGRALAVVRPADTAQAAAVVRACARHGASLVPQGGNTSMVGGATPPADGSALILSLRRMNRIRSIDPAAGLAVVEAGV
ncbi:MAG: FAD-binding protein, partial [Burkholderiaceae bacterium]|nr:FAD-binding protein [Burkholderiaceae bacterium]